MNRFGFLLLAAIVLWADPAWAWGPVAHLWYGNEALREISNVGAVLQRLLETHRWAYLYGCLAPDIIHVKSYGASVYTHCHGWHVGWRILDEARSDEERAFAWGYLSHLAADVYSHNHYVPARMLASYPSRLRRHVFWEAWFDARFGSEDRKRLTDVRARRTGPGEALVERVVERTLFSFRTNQRIFGVVVGIQQLDTWQATVARVTRGSRANLTATEFRSYQAACVDAARDVLANGPDAEICRFDPNGHATLARVREIRRKLRTLGRRGESTRMLRARVRRRLGSALPASPEPAR